MTINPIVKNLMIQISTYPKRINREKLRKARMRYNHWRNTNQEAKHLICSLFAITQGKCQECSKDMWLAFTNKENGNKATLDHVNPIREMDKNDNIFTFRLICKDCNSNQD